MKTQVYNLSKKMAALAAVAVMTVVPIAKVDAQEHVSISLMAKPAAYFATTACETIRTAVGVCAELESEASLTIEKWMSDSQFWGTRELEANEEEAPLVVEKWMSNDQVWSGSEVVEAEPSMAVEQWMECNQTWGVENAAEVIDYEQPLALEKWMDCNNYWLGSKFCEPLEEQLLVLDLPLAIEPWMNSNRVWGYNAAPLASN